MRRSLLPPAVVPLLLGVVMATAQILANDPECLSIGGMCLDLNSCPSESRANETGLCQNEQLGERVCCHGVPVGASCRQKGGRCGQKEECRNVEDFGQLDCDKGSKCCLLIF